jgi:hypothetical protein
MAAARTLAVEDRVPEGFEHRVLRAIGSGRAELRGAEADDWTVFWFRGLYRALIPAASCLVVAGALLLHRRGVAESAASALNGASAGDRETEEWVLLEALEAGLGEADL